MRRALLALTTALALGSTLGMARPATARAATSVQIRVLGNRADLVSGGEALVEIVVPAGVDPSTATVDLDGRDVTSKLAAGRIPGLLTSIPTLNHLAVRPDDNALVGLVTGLRVGANHLTARLRDGSGATITITNHPIGGPVFAGSQVQPWICNTLNPPNPPVGAGQPVFLGASTNAQCDTPSKVQWFYHATDASVCASQANASQPPCFATYDPANPPSSVATTTTDEGVTVPYIVRVEEGVEDRGIYALAVLDDPTKTWAPWAPQKAWNHKLVYTFGASTAVHHVQGQPDEVLDEPVTASNSESILNWFSPDSALSRGFMVANNALNIGGENANDITSAESMLMLKEHISDTYGLIRYTIGTGCSGGGRQQYLIAAAYPGLIDGIQPNCSFPDIWTTAQEVFDCVLLLNYAQNTGDATSEALADGHLNTSDCEAWNATFGTADEPTSAGNCALSSGVYNPSSDPRGVRCDIQDYTDAIWGPRPPTVWGSVEKSIGVGFSGRPFDNVGVQYGLQALNAGTLSVPNFLALNGAIGGFDIDLKPQAARSVADPGTVATAYLTDQVTDARQLATVPIVDLRAYSENSEIHTSYHSYEVRARLDAANGTHSNQIIWTWDTTGPILFVTPPVAIALQSLLLIDSWLAKIEADPSSTSLAAKVIADKPAAAVDACFPVVQQTMTEVTDPTVCSARYPYYGDSRIVAGAPLTDDILKCALKSPAPSDYKVTFSATLWQTLLSIFPNGVCDYSKPGVDQQRSIPWVTFAGGPGGIPLGDPPVSLPFGATPVLAAPGISTTLPNTAAPAAPGATVALLAGGLALTLASRSRRTPLSRRPRRP